MMVKVELLRQGDACITKIVERVGVASSQM